MDRIEVPPNFVVTILIYLLILQTVVAKIFKKCDLALQLRYKYGFTFDETSTLLCIAEASSHFNTDTTNNILTRNTHLHGIFQLQEGRCCHSETWEGKVLCDLRCEDLRNDDIQDDVECVKKVIRYRTRSGIEFKAWQPYRDDCTKKRAKEIIDECKYHFDSVEKIFQAQISLLRRVSEFKEIVQNFTRIINETENVEMSSESLMDIMDLLFSLDNEVVDNLYPFAY